MTSPGALPTREEIAEIVRSHIYATTDVRQPTKVDTEAIADAILARLRPAWEEDQTLLGKLAAERGALRADLDAVSLRAQEWEIKWAHADANLRACAEALEVLVIRIPENPDESGEWYPAH